MSSQMVSNLNPFSRPKDPGPSGYAPDAADALARQTNNLAGANGNANPLTPQLKLASAGTVDNQSLVQPRIDALTNLFNTRNAYLKQKSAMPGLRASTYDGGGLLGAGGMS